jgi:glutamyl-tRNA reductase
MAAKGMTPIEIEQLTIAELGSNSDVVLSLESADHLFEIRTCQRTLFIGSTETLTRADLLLFSNARRTFEGADAYQLLLRFACGLESEIKGETDVFGQVKTAFKNLAENNPALSQAFQPIYLKLLEDTKEIRTNYLQGIGGNTYGALSRRILNPTAEDRVVVLGAGQISKSVAPYFAEFGLKIWNRTEARLHDLANELTLKGHKNFKMVQSQEDLVSSVKEATIVIMATPMGAETDTFVLSLVQSLNPTAKILHLGGQAHEANHFASHSSFWSLTDLFTIEKEQNLIREKQVLQAIDACHHRAILRNMARSIHISHGWEDLALFY